MARLKVTPVNQSESSSLSNPVVTSTSSAAQRKQIEQRVHKEFLKKLPPLAYIKLEGKNAEKNWVQYITTLPIELGRGSTRPEDKNAASGTSTSTGGGSVASNTPKINKVDLGNHKSISRKHAKVAFNASIGSYEIRCIGKNGILVNKQFIAKDKTVPLNPQDAIKIGPVRFYFLPALPPRKPLNMTGSDVLVQAFQGGPKTRIQAVNDFIELYSSFDVELGGKANVEKLINYFCASDHPAVKVLGNKDEVDPESVLYELDTAQLVNRKVFLKGPAKLDQSSKKRPISEMNASSTTTTHEAESRHSSTDVLKVESSTPTSDHNADISVDGAATASSSSSTADPSSKKIKLS